MFDYTVHLEWCESIPAASVSFPDLARQVQLPLRPLQVNFTITSSAPKVATPKSQPSVVAITARSSSGPKKPLQGSASTCPRRSGIRKGSHACDYKLINHLRHKDSTATLRCSAFLSNADYTLGILRAVAEASRTNCLLATWLTYTCESLWLVHHLRDVRSLNTKRSPGLMTEGSVLTCS